MNTDVTPLIDALTRQRNEQADRLAHTEAALVQASNDAKALVDQVGKLQSQLDDLNGLLDATKSAMDELQKRNALLESKNVELAQQVQAAQPAPAAPAEATVS
jgi:chromosome segregation ATPase